MNMKYFLIFLLAATAVLNAQTPLDISSQTSSNMRSDYISTYNSSVNDLSEDKTTTLKISSTKSDKYIMISLDTQHPQIILSEEILDYLGISSHEESLIRISPGKKTDYSAPGLLWDIKSFKAGYGQGSCRYGIVTNVYSDQQSAKAYAKEMNDIYHIFAYAMDINEAGKTYYCVIAGNFKSKEAARTTLDRIRILNPNAYIVEI